MDFIGAASGIPNLVGVVLFGSAVTGDVSKKSDIDLLLVFDSPHNPEIGEESKTAHRIASDIAKKHDLAHSFSLVFVNQRNVKETEPDFLWNVCRDGILIWAKPQQIISKTHHPVLEPMAIVRYSLTGLGEKNRRKILRRLFGYSRSGKNGIIDKSRERLGPGVVLVRAPKVERLKHVFGEFKIRNYSVKKLWTH